MALTPRVAYCTQIIPNRLPNVRTDAGQVDIKRAVKAACRNRIRAATIRVVVTDAFKKGRSAYESHSISVTAAKKRQINSEAGALRLIRVLCFEQEDLDHGTHGL